MRTVTFQTGISKDWISSHPTVPGDEGVRTAPRQRRWGLPGETYPNPQCATLESPALRTTVVTPARLTPADPAHERTSNGSLVRPVGVGSVSESALA